MVGHPKIFISPQEVWTRHYKFRGQDLNQPCLFIGNIFNDYFHYSLLLPEDLPWFIEILLIMVAVDAISLVVSGIVLKKRCNINLLAVFMFQHREFGVALGVTTGSSLANLFYNCAIANGYDATNENTWLQRFSVNVTSSDDWRFSKNIDTSFL